MIERITGLITFLSNYGIPTELVLIVIFLLFLWVVKKITSVFIGVLKVLAVSVLFPFILQKVGLIATVDINTILFWINIGMLIYILYLMYRTATGFGKLIKKLFGR
ncbi:MAG: hypothetical protein J7J92_01785 [Candidatus Aenigmarchaeota archaeon]|nr:hypothetical protein [Candidatus Aenigmarchaeota archaeon]